MKTGSMSPSPDSNSVTRPPMQQLLSTEVHLKLWHPSTLLQSRAQLSEEEATDADSWEKLLAFKTSLYVLVPDLLFIVSILLSFFVVNIVRKFRAKNKNNVILIIFSASKACINCIYIRVCWVFLENMREKYGLCQEIKWANIFVRQVGKYDCCTKCITCFIPLTMRAIIFCIIIFPALFFTNMNSEGKI